jgi:apolipoprotein N-acyltransferase
MYPVNRISTGKISMKTYQKIILSALSALLLFLSFMDLGFFIWFALIPFLFVIKGSSLKMTVLYSFICGVGFFAGMTFWLLELYVKFIWPLVIIILSIYFIVFGIAAYFIINKIKNSYLRIFMIPALWILIEFARSQTFLAFTIGILGYSQHNFLPLMHITRFTGIYGVSFIILLFNVALFETIIYFNRNRRFKLKFLVISFSILILFIIYGLNSVNHTLDRVVREKGYEQVNIASVQPKILFGNKYSDRGMEVIPERYSTDSYFKPGTELVIFPESALWGNIDENPVFSEWALNAMEEEDLNILIGQYTHDGNKEVWHNSILLYDRQLNILGKYDEVHPVPFSQYMPHPDILGFLKFLDFSIVNLKPGKDTSPIMLPNKGYLGFNVCYESTLPGIARQFRNNGAEAIIVVSDDSSLGDSIAPWHHLIFSKVRAIENGCYVVHSSITGFSAIISPDGSIMEKADLMQKDVIYGEIYLMEDKTFYAKYGDLLLYIYLILTAISAAAYFAWKGIRCRKSR